MTNPFPLSASKRKIVIAGLAIAFILLSLPFMNRLPDTWECFNVAACRHAAQSGVPTKSDVITPDSLLLAHPPSWVYTVAVFYRILGTGLWQARLPGLLVVLLTGWFLFLLARRLFSERIAWAATALYLTNPGAIQGALYIGYSEGTYLPLAVTFFCWAWIKYQSASVLRRSVALSIAIALAFWAKGTTSLALPLCLGITIIFQKPSSDDAPGRLGRAILTCIAATAGGAGLFLISWGLTAWKISHMTGMDLAYIFQRPLIYLWSEGGRSTQVSIGLNLWTDIPLMSVRVAMYIGPFLWMGALWATWSRLKTWWKNRGLAPEDIIPLCVWSISLVFVVLHGGTGGFPKNHFAILPLLCLLCAIGLENMLRSDGFDAREFFIILAIGIAYYAFVVGDPVIVLNHTLRHAVMRGDSLKPVVLELFIRLGLYAVFPIASLWLINFRFDRSRLSGRALAAVLASQIGLTVCQSMGSYFVAYSYGSPIQDLKDTIALVQQETGPSDPLLALPELACEADRPTVPGLGRVQWEDPMALANVLEIQRPKMMIYGMPAHPVDQMQTVVKDIRLRSVMQRYYELSAVGEYRVWIRKEKK